MQSCILASSALAALAASPIPAEHAINITVYHLNAADAGDIPINMDTGDAEGDLNFYLDQYLLPLECADPNARDFWSKFDCNNPERKGDLVVTRVEMEVDARFTNYSACNYCDTGIDPMSHQPCEIGKYVCDCEGHHHEKGICDPRRVGMEKREAKVTSPNCTAALASTCGALKENATACTACWHENYDALRAAQCGNSDIQTYCPIVDSCQEKLESLCGDVKKNASACSDCRHNHSDELKAAGCGDYDGYRWCPSTSCSAEPGNEWKCWHQNIAQKAGGYWYSHLEAGLCNEYSTPGSCGWRVFSTSTVHEKCLRDTLADTMEAADETGCFSACEPRNESSPCWIGCFFDTLLGPEARHNGSAGAVTGMPLEDVIAGWTKSFLPESAGGCPKVGESAMCKDHPGCAGLAPDDGLCCPVASGERLACCDTPAIISDEALCKNHAGCAHLTPLDGMCCPVPSGVRLACCDEVTIV